MTYLEALGKSVGTAAKGLGFVLLLGVASAPGAYFVIHDRWMLAAIWYLAMIAAWIAWDARMLQKWSR